MLMYRSPWFTIAENGGITIPELVDRMIGVKPADIGTPAPYNICINGSEIQDVIFNNPATVVLWSDGTKTVVKCQDGDKYSKETGLAMCIIKKLCGNKGNYNNLFAKWIVDKGVNQ